MRLIDADTARKEANRIWDMWNLANVGATSQKEINKVFKMMELFDAVGYVIDNIPTVDAVPVVRCKDCKYCKEYEYNSNIRLFCDYDDACKLADDFCSWAERKTE